MTSFTPKILVDRAIGKDGHWWPKPPHPTSPTVSPYCSSNPSILPTWPAKRHYGIQSAPLTPGRVRHCEADASPVTLVRSDEHGLLGMCRTGTPAVSIGSTKTRRSPTFETRAVADFSETRSWRAFVCDRTTPCCQCFFVYRQRLRFKCVCVRLPRMYRAANVFQRANEACVLAL